VRGEEGAEVGVDEGVGDGGCGEDAVVAGEAAAVEEDEDWCWCWSWWVRGGCG
jgi:hypothetical protein